MEDGAQVCFGRHGDGLLEGGRGATGNLGLNGHEGDSQAGVARDHVGSDGDIHWRHGIPLERNLGSVDNCVDIEGPARFRFLRH